MKDLCEKTFFRYYADTLYADTLGADDFVEGQEAYQENIAYNVQQLIGKPSLFHFGPDDVHVSLL